MHVTWNITRHRNRYTDADVVVLSVGKSGRTWLRVLLNKLLSLHYGVEFSLQDLHQERVEIPSVMWSHELWSHRRVANARQRLTGKFIIPDEILFRKKLLVLYRDPRDVAVSLYFQNQKRSRRKYAGDISDYVRHPKYGIRNVIDVMNAWRQRFENHPQCLWLSYEAMKEDTDAALLRVARFIGVEGIEAATVRQAVAFAEFENMKKMERDRVFGAHRLNPSDSSDPDSYKVREGKVGGHRQYFEDADLRFLEESLQGLDPFFGYLG